MPRFVKKQEIEAQVEESKPQPTYQDANHFPIEILSALTESNERLSRVMGATKKTVIIRDNQGKITELITQSL